MKKNNFFSNILLEIFEKNLNIEFTEYQRNTLLDEIEFLLQKNSDIFGEFATECDKIKNVTNTKISTRPSYKNYIAKPELKKYIDSTTFSVTRFNFLNYISSDVLYKKTEIANNLIINMHEIKKILDKELYSLNKKLKILFIIMFLLLASVPVAPEFGAINIIITGIVATVVQTQSMVVNNKINKVILETNNIKELNSSLIDETIENLDYNVSELLNDFVYREVAELYVKKKKKMLNEYEIKKKIELQIILAINNHILSMSESKKEEIIDKMLIKDCDDEIDEHIDIKVELEI